MDVTCPSCGRPLQVPRLRELSTLEVTNQAPAARTWRVSHAWFLIGAVVATVAGLTGSLLSRFDGGASQRLPDEQLIRAAVESADAPQIHKAWLAVKRSGVDRGAVPEEMLVRQAADSVGRVAVLAWSVAALAALGAIAGGIASLVSLSRRGTPSP